MRTLGDQNHLGFSLMPCDSYQILSVGCDILKGGLLRKVLEIRRAVALKLGYGNIIHYFSNVFMVSCSCGALELMCNLFFGGFVKWQKYFALLYFLHFAG